MKGFTYRYQVKASDIWQVRMYYAYASYLAVVNLTCIIASVALIVTQWAKAGAVFRAIMLIFLSLFLVLQPLVIYLNARAQAKQHPEEITLSFGEDALTIETAGRRERHPWNDIISLTVRPTLVIVYTDPSHGYILTNRVLKDTRKEFLEFARSKREKKGMKMQ